MADVSKESLEQLTQSELFQKISDICATVNIVTDTKELLERSLIETMELLTAQRGSIFIQDEGSEKLTLKYARGLALDEEEKIDKKLGEGVVGLVAEQKIPIVVEDITKDDRFDDYKGRESYQTPSFICAPLLLKDKLIGVINIADKIDGTRFSSNELQLLDFLSSQIALNYRRIQLYQQFEKMRQESKDLKDELGKSSEEATHLKKQVIQHEKLASIGKLAGGIAHEFNNPLDGVMRYTNLCLDQAKDDEVLTGYLKEIRDGLKRMANIVKSLLACSRNIDATHERVDVNGTIEQVVQSLEGGIVHKNIKLKQTLAVGLPQIIDLGLERIITNLVRNAIDAVEEGGAIEIATELKDPNILISISDTGCGIKGGSIEEIFEPFHTTKDIDKGFGLGLTIVSEIVKNYKGNISVESDTEEGTTFTVTLPVNKEE